MAITCGFFNSVGGDRTYNALQISNILEGVIDDGVFQSVGAALAVTPGTGLTVVVGTGRAWFNKTWTSNDANLVVPIDLPDLVKPRIDAVVLEINTSDGVRNNSIKVIKGTPETVPVNPTLTNTSTIHQYPLIYLRVNVGATGFTSGNITNMIGTPDCPYILSLRTDKATAAEVATGTNDLKFVTPKAIKDSVNVPNVAPGTNGKYMRSNGSAWQSASILPADISGLTSLNIGDIIGAQYTPTFFAGTNCETTPALVQQVAYLKIGNHVVVSGNVQVNPSAAGPIDFGISLPIASDLSAAGHCTGVIHSSIFEDGIILADVANDRAKVMANVTGVAAISWYFIFMYRIL